MTVTVAGNQGDIIKNEASQDVEATSASTNKATDKEGVAYTLSNSPWYVLRQRLYSVLC